MTHVPTLNLAQRVALGLIRLYQMVLSPFYSGSCRFLPSCSAYASEAITAHGLARGTLLAVRRLGRCHPFAEPGVDPVPLATRRH